MIERGSHLGIPVEPKTKYDPQLATSVPACFGREMRLPGELTLAASPPCTDSARPARGIEPRSAAEGLMRPVSCKPPADPDRFVIVPTGVLVNAVAASCGTPRGTVRALVNGEVARQAVARRELWEGDEPFASPAAVHVRETFTATSRCRSVNDGTADDKRSRGVDRAAHNVYIWRAKYLRQRGGPTQPPRQCTGRLRLLRRSAERRRDRKKTRVSSLGGEQYGSPSGDEQPLRERRDPAAVQSMRPASGEQEIISLQLGAA